jgi:hypothetical protein
MHFLKAWEREKKRQKYWKNHAKAIEKKTSCGTIQGRRTILNLCSKQCHFKHLFF